MRKWFILATIATIGIVLLSPHSARAESVDLNLKINGIECNLNAVYDELGFIPTYCSNQPEPSSGLSPSDMTSQQSYAPINETPQVPITTHSMGTPVIPPTLKMLLTVDAGAVPASSGAQMTIQGSFITAIIAAASATSVAAAVDALYFGGKFTKGILSLISRLLK